MAHTHVVVDSDAYFTIDPMTRAIKKEESSKTSLIVGDHNSERFSFELPRYIEGHDMSLCNVVRVHYMNTSSSKTELQSVGVYEVDDFGVLPTDDTKMRLSWLISNNATKYVGKLAFTVQFACMSGYRVNYSWQSGVYSSISISDGINGSEIVFDEYADILQQWWLKLYASSELPITVLTAEEFAALDGNTEPEVLYILEDDPSVSMLENHDVTLIEHAERINSAEIDIKNLDDKFAEHTDRIDNAETLIEDYGDRIGNAETLIADHGNRIDNAETDITAHANEITELKDAVESLCTYEYYTLITDAKNETVKQIQSGLWLFHVKYGIGGPVSVIMDTACVYSSMFTVSRKVGENENEITENYIAALKRTNIESIDGLVTVRLVYFTRNTLSNNPDAFNESYIGDEIIYGRPFGFSNPKG